MQVRWKKLVAKTAIWLAAEVVLNVLGLDNLADYGEFVFERTVVGINNTPAIVIIQ